MTPGAAALPGCLSRAIHKARPVVRIERRDGRFDPCLRSAAPIGADRAHGGAR